MGVRYDRCGTCGSTLTSSGTCPVCDRRRYTHPAVLDAELVLLLAAADLELET